MKNKGCVRVAADADITIFDAVAIEDRATYESPAQSSAGIRYVIVNGVPVVERGQLIESEKPGQAIRNARR